MARSTLDVPPPLRRIVARHTAAWLVCAVAGAWCASAALAQEAGGPIVIPGPGEQNPADLARMTAMATSSNASPRTINPQFAATLAPPAQSSTPQATDRFTRLSNASGAIVIPGTDEASAPGAPNVPANTTVIQQASPANTASLTRVNMNPALAASQVVPVVVTSMPARATYGAALRPVNAAPAAAPVGVAGRGTRRDRCEQRRNRQPRFARRAARTGRERGRPQSGASRRCRAGSNDTPRKESGAGAGGSRAARAGNSGAATGSGGSGRSGAAASADSATGAQAGGGRLQGSAGPDCCRNSGIAAGSGQRSPCPKVRKTAS